MQRRFFNRNFWLFGLLVFIVSTQTLPLFAQSEPRDYGITNVGYSFTDDNSAFSLEFTVANAGGDASGTTTIQIISLTDEREVLVEEDLPPLAAGETAVIKIPFDVTDFESESVQALRIRVGVDSFELNGSPIAEDNTQDVSVPIPRHEGIAATGSAPLFEQNPDGSISILGARYEPTELLAMLVIVIGLFIMIWLLSIILRLIFRRPARLERWDPPYGHVPPMDPNSQEGRRYEWQRYALNGGFFIPPQEGAYHAIKLLLSEQDRNLENWTVSGLRLSQYDQYGMISSTNTVAERRLVKRLNRIVRHQEDDTQEQFEKKLQPIAKGLVKQLRKRISKKTAFLPIEFDVRFLGKHGEIKILFELYQLRQGAWYRIDQWEPEMQIIGQDIHESYRYTIHGRVSGEQTRDFYKRLEADLIWLLVDTIRNPIVLQRYQPVAPPVREDPPETLTGLSPVTDQHPAVT